MADLVYCPTNLLFFDIPFLYCYTNLNSSIISCPSFGDIYLSFGVSDSSLASLFCGFLECNSIEDFFETLVILSAILLPIKSPVASAVFLDCSFWSSFYCICVDFFVLSRHFWLCLLLKCLPMFFSKYKNPYPFTYILFLDWIEYLIFIMTVLFNY